MNDEDLIEFWKKELYMYEYTKDLDLSMGNYFGQFEEKINTISGMLNLIEKRDKVINLMAEQLTTPVHSKEGVIDYYKREIEK